VWYVNSVSFGLQAPAAVPVEVRAAGRRVFRLTREVGEQGIRLEQPAPFEIGRPVEIRFQLPDSATGLTLRAEIVEVDDASEREGAAGGCGLRLIDAVAEDRQAIVGYVSRRLGLPQR
jgi:hypothetical protein